MVLGDTGSDSYFGHFPSLALSPSICSMRKLAAGLLGPFQLGHPMIL